MKTDQLIASLAADDRPIPNPARMLALSMIAGAAAALGFMWLLFGAPILLSSEMAARALKVGYPAAVSIIAAAAALQAGRPAARPTPRMSLLAVPVAAVAAMALLILSSTSFKDWDDQLFGSTFVTCLYSVTLAGIPTFASLSWVFRLLAPTKPRLAGFLIGLASGGVAAAAYGLYCKELSPAFLIGAYTPAMLILALAGVVLGPRLLRW